MKFWNSVLCALVTDAADRQTRYGKLWAAEAQGYFPALERTVEKLKKLQIVWQQCQIKEGIGPLPSHDDLQGLQTLLRTWSVMPSDISIALVTLANDVQVVRDGTATPEILRRVLERFTLLQHLVREHRPQMCGVPLQGTEWDDSDD